MKSTIEKKLQEIAEIQFGSSVNKSSEGTIICFQVSDIKEDGSVQFDNMTYAKPTPIDDTDFLKPGDILIPAKGTKLSAVTVTREFLPAVASPSLFVIRIYDEGVTPEYLQWFLNLNRTQWELQKDATGTNIPSLSIRDLRRLKISVPEKEAQDKINHLRNLWLREEEIVTQLGDKRRKLIKAVTKKMITNEINS